MVDCNPTKIPINPGAKWHEDNGGVTIDAIEYRRVIGYLRYLLHTSLDLAFSVGMASRFMQTHTIMDSKAVKQILRYLKGTIDFGVVYTKEEKEEKLVGYTDSY
jgi:hypothetical protein